MHTTRVLTALTALTLLSTLNTPQPGRTDRAGTETLSDLVSTVLDVWVQPARATEPTSLHADYPAQWVFRGFSNATDLAVDDATGMVYIGQYNPDGADLLRLTPAGDLEVVVPDLTNMPSVAVGGDGYVYTLVSYGSTEVLRVDPSDGSYTVISNDNGALASGPTGDIYHLHDGQIDRYDPVSATWSVVVSGLTVSTLRLAVDSNENFYALIRGSYPDYLDDLIRIDGVTGVQTVLASGLTSVQDLDVTPTDDVWVVENDFDTVQQLVQVAPDGTETVLDSLMLASALGIADDGSAYVANRGQGELRRYDALGAYTVAFRTIAEGSGAAIGPDGMLYVSGEDIITRLSPHGGSPEVVTTGIGNPGELDFDSAGNLFVSSYDGSVYAVDAAGNLDLLYTAPYGLIGLTVDDRDRIFTVSHVEGEVHEVYPGGGGDLYALMDGGSGCARGYGMHTDLSGKVWIADVGCTGTLLSIAPDADLRALDDRLEIEHYVRPYFHDSDDQGNLFYTTYPSSTVKLDSAGVSTVIATDTGYSRGLVLDQNTGVVYTVRPDGVVRLGALPPLTLDVDDPALSGANVTLTVTGAAPGETVSFAWSSDGPGAGPCSPRLDGECADLLKPRLAARVTADSTGTATFSKTLPAATSGRDLWFQAFHPGGAMVKTDIVHRRVK